MLIYVLEVVSGSVIAPMSRTRPEPVMPVMLVTELVAEVAEPAADVAEVEADDADVAAFVAEVAAALAEFEALVA
jgi:hypothetical protein